MEWLEEGVRYVGYFFEPRKELAVKQREEGMQGAEAELNRLAQIAAKGSYYSWTRLRETINDLLESCGVRGLHSMGGYKLNEIRGVRKCFEPFYVVNVVFPG